jgi:hypothetical protein
MTRDFDDLVGGDLPPGERRRLEEVHEMLLAAGPPPDLPAALREPPAPADLDENVVPLPSRQPRGRRRAAWALVAAVVVLALACLGGGYALGDHFASNGGDVVRAVSLEGSGARASVSLESVQKGGNWPMELTVSGLPQQSDRGYYELFVWRDGKPGYPCVGFKMARGTTTVRFTVPYELKDGTELVVTAIEPGKVSWPGKVVMRTA